MSKRIVSFFLCFVMAFSLSVVPSSADYIGTPVTLFDRLLHWSINGADDVSPELGALGQFSGFIFGTVCTGSDDGYHHADSISGCESGTDKDGQYAVAMCRYCGESFKVYGADLESAYNSYVTDLGFTEINSDGKLVWYPDVYAVKLNIGGEVAYFGDYPNGQTTLTHYSASCIDMVNPVVTFQSLDSSYAARNTINITVYYSGVCPIDGIYYDFNSISGRLQILTTSNSNLDYSYTQSSTYSTKQMSAGDVWKDDAAPGRFTSSSGGSAYSGSISAARPYVLIEPMGDIPVDSTSRPTTLIGDYGIIGDDGTIIHVEGDVIVDESNTTIYNPVTNVTNVFTDWAFDYSTRTYTLTLEDGSTVTVTYGNENITINEGDTIYNVYYILPSEDDPGAEPDAPGTDDGSGWAWLKGAWTEMMDKLSGILEAITGLELSPEINVDVDVDMEGEEQETQESWFSKLLTKFSFLTSVHDIYSQLIADVTSDAATAAAVADGEVMLADVTNGHASVYAAERHGFYTVPELAISFGSSDKYGVDWANIRPLDLSWYAPYKDTVDGILSGILWLSYLFLLIKRAPGIIRGAEMVTEDRIKIDDWRIRH